MGRPAQCLAHGWLTISGCFLPFPSDSFLPSCHSLNFFSGDQSPASFEGRFDFGKSPRSRRGSSGQGGRRLVIKPRKEHPLDVQMGSSPARGRTSFSGASSASLERGRSCWEPWFCSAGGLLGPPPRGAGLRPPGRGQSAMPAVQREWNWLLGLPPLHAEPDVRARMTHRPVHSPVLFK